MTEFGYLLPSFEDGDMVELGVRAEQAGFDSVWVPDSPFVYGLPDPVTLLAGLATATSRVALAPGVLLAALHQPVLLAHRLATLDRMSGGRLIVGLGYGFNSPETERQFAAAGVPFAERTGRLTETIAVLRALWSGKLVSHAGRYFAFDEMTLSPAPATPPPIWLAGAGAVAERRVGRLADGWLPYLPTAALYAEGLRRVQDEGRSVTPALYVTVALDQSVDVARRRLRNTVERWYSRPFEAISARQATFAGTPAGLWDWLAAYLEAGVRHVVLRVAHEEPRRGLDTISQALSMR
jgi:probable F420-dependent oxidoreductase